MITGTALLGVVLVGAMVARRGGAAALRHEAPWLVLIALLFGSLVVTRRFIEDRTGIDLITPLLVVTALVLLIGRSQRQPADAAATAERPLFQRRSIWWVVAGLVLGSMLLASIAALAFGR